MDATRSKKWNWWHCVHTSIYRCPFRESSISVQKFWLFRVVRWQNVTCRRFCTWDRLHMFCRCRCGRDCRGHRRVKVCVLPLRWVNIAVLLRLHVSRMWHVTTDWCPGSQSDQFSVTAARSSSSERPSCVYTSRLYADTAINFRDVWMICHWF